MKLLLQEIGKLLVTREAKIDQHGLPRWTEKDVGRFEIEVQHVLIV